MKLMKALSMMASVGALVAFMGALASPGAAGEKHAQKSGNAQEDEPIVLDDEPIVEDFKIFPKRIIGQTCVESSDKTVKCTTLTTTDFVPVASLDFRTLGAQDVLVQFCAKVEDKMSQGLECQALVDTVAAEPGSVTPNDNLTETIYNFCTSWFGEAAGTWRGVTTVDIECKNKQEADMTDEIDIVNYVATVFSR